MMTKSCSTFFTILNRACPFWCPLSVLDTPISTASALWHSHAASRGLVSASFTTERAHHQGDGVLLELAIIPTGELAGVRIHALLPFSDRSPVHKIEERSLPPRGR